MTYHGAEIKTPKKVWSAANIITPRFFLHQLW
jgi:hypothetical protein